VDLSNLDSATKKKLFGTCSVTDYVKFGSKEGMNEGLGVKGYEIHPNSRFNF